MAVHISVEKVRSLGRVPWLSRPQEQDELITLPLEALRRQLEAVHGQFVRSINEQLSSEAEALLKPLRLRLRIRYQGLSSHARERSGNEFADSARTEFQTLAQQIREIVLARAARPSKVSWLPSDTVSKVESLLEPIPEKVKVPIPVSVYSAQKQDSVMLAARRLVAGGVASIGRALNRLNTRSLPLRSMVVWHMRKAFEENLEGVCVLLVQAEADLQARAFHIYEIVTREIEALIAEPELPAEKLATLWEDLRKEIERAELEIARYVEDCSGRMSSIYVRALANLEVELPIMSTFRLSPSAREGESTGPGHARVVGALERRLSQCRGSVSSGYLSFALRVELSSFRFRAQQELESKIRELESVVRGRLLKQLQRLHIEIDVAVETLAGAEGSRERKEADRPRQGGSQAGTQSIPKASTTDPHGALLGAKQTKRGATQRVMDAGRADASGPAPGVSSLPLPEASLLDEDQLGRVIDKVARVLRDARKAAKPGIESVSSASALGGLLEDLAVEAQDLTDEYEVPSRKLPRSEWTLPKVPSEVSVPFAQLVATFIETDIAPKLIETVTTQVSSLGELQDTFDEVGRIARLSGEQFEIEALDDGLGLEVDNTDRSRTRVVLLRAFQEVRERVSEVERRVEAWSDALAGPLRRELRVQLDRLEQGFGDQELSQTVAGAKTRINRGARSQSALRERGFLGILFNSPSRVKEAVNDRRIDSVKRALGLPTARTEASLALLSPLRVPADVPLYYRRLFAPLGAWVSDVLIDGADGANLSNISRGGLKGRIRSAAVIGVEVTERRAMLSSLTRGEQFRNARSVQFTEPTGSEGVKEALAQESSSDGVVVISGLYWLMSAQPGGFDGLRALCDVILADGGQNRYIVDADSTAWDWARTIAPVDAIFSHQIQTPQFSAEQLDTILTARHALSGMDLRFGRDGDDKARTRYFRTLRGASDGRLTHALLFWLGSVRQVEEGPTSLVRLGELPTSPYKLLRDLDEDTLHISYLIARQGWMTSMVLALLLGARQTSAEGLLSKMLGLGLVERNAEQIYLPRRHLSSALRRVFAERQWV